MIMRLVLPRYEKVHFLSGICSLFLRKEDEVHYIGGAEILPPPLEGEREAYCIRMLDGVHAERARKELISKLFSASEIPCDDRQNKRRNDRLDPEKCHSRCAVFQ